MYKVSGFLFPDNFSSSKKTSFLLGVLSVFNFYSDETLIAKRSSASMYLFYLFYCLTCCSSTQHRSSSMAKIHSIPHLFTGSFAVKIREHLRSRIICGPFWGLLAVWGSFAVGDHLRYRTRIETLCLCKILIFLLKLKKNSWPF